MFRCDLPLALLAEWPGSFTCHCGNMVVEWTLHKSQHTNLTLEKKILPSLLPGFKLVTFWSWIRAFTNKLSRPPSLPTYLSNHAAQAQSLHKSSQSKQRCLKLSFLGKSSWKLSCPGTQHWCVARDDFPWWGQVLSGDTGTGTECKEVKTERAWLRSLAKLKAN